MRGSGQFSNILCWWYIYARCQDCSTLERNFENLIFKVLKAIVLIEVCRIMSFGYMLCSAKKSESLWISIEPVAVRDLIYLATEIIVNNLKRVDENARGLRYSPNLERITWGPFDLGLVMHVCYGEREITLWRVNREAALSFCMMEVARGGFSNVICYNTLDAKL